MKILNKSEFIPKEPRAFSIERESIVVKPEQMNAIFLEVMIFIVTKGLIVISLLE